MRGRLPLTTAILVVLALTLGMRVLALVVTDGLWFTEIGHADVFLRLLGADLGAALAAGLLVAGAVGASGAWALSQTRNRPVMLSPDWRSAPAGRWLRRPEALGELVRSGALLFGLMAGLGALGSGRVLLAAWHGVPFGVPDPLLAQDASFYVHVLPALELVRSTLLGAVVLAAVAAVGVYAVRGAVALVAVRSEGREVATVRFDAGPRRHVALLVTAATLLLAVGFHLERYALLHAEGTRLDGPGWTAARVVLPLLTGQAVATAFAAFLLFQAIDRLRGPLVVAALALMAGGGLLRGVLPDLAQSLLVEPNELDRESRYLGHHIRATREAWGLDEVEERPLGGQTALTWADVEAHRATVDNIRLWDHDELLAAFRQTQEIRTFYEFTDVDDDRYVIDGELRQVMVSPRELLSETLSEQARTWVNRSLVYTHGYGLALGPVNAVTAQGLPQLWIRDLPPVAAHDVLRVEQPAIYFGEATREPVFVRTGTREFDYPTRDSEERTTYAGEAGIPVGGWARRLLIALRLGDANALLSSEVQAGSRLLLYRDVVERVARLAPFLDVDGDPMIVVADGRLVWLVDAFVTSDRYPYGAHQELVLGHRRVVRASYVREAVKATVDAYDGTVTLYALDADEPLTRTWQAVFPGLMQPIEAMPASLRSHLRYPASLLRAQAELLATFHMTDPESFYNREDEWEIPAVAGVPTRPYDLVMRLPGEDTAEFLSILPFAPRGKTNLAAWTAARADGDRYGELRVYRFPKDRHVFGPGQMAARFDQDDAVREQLTLWNQGASGGAERARRGTLLIVPLGESLLYVQPVYLRAASGGIPELKRVIVGHDDRVTMQPTLEAGLRVLFGGPSADLGPVAMVGGVPGEASDGSEGVEEARARYAALKAAAAEGRWEAFGRELEALGRVLEALVEEAPPAEVLPEAPEPGEAAP